MQQQEEDEAAAAAALLLRSGLLPTPAEIEAFLGYTYGVCVKRGPSYACVCMYYSISDFVSLHMYICVCMDIDRPINQCIHRPRPLPKPTHSLLHTQGFVGPSDPLPRLSGSAFEPYEALAAALPRLLATGQLRPAVDALNDTQNPGRREAWEAMVDGLADERARRRALLLFAGLANAYVWGGGPDVEPRDRIPACACVRAFVDAV